MGVTVLGTGGMFGIASALNADPETARRFQNWYRGSQFHASISNTPSAPPKPPVTYEPMQGSKILKELELQSQNKYINKYYPTGSSSSSSTTNSFLFGMVCSAASKAKKFIVPIVFRWYCA